MFWSRQASRSKSLEEKDPLAEVVVLTITKEGRIKFYGIKIGDKYGCDKTGAPISSRDYRYVSNLVWKYNQRTNSAS